jgi:hypothetical protein
VRNAGVSSNSRSGDCSTSAGSALGAGTGQAPYPAHWALACQLAYGAVPVAALIGAWASRHDWQRLWPLYLLFASLTAVYSVFFVRTRYRMILEPFLLVLAAHGLVVAAGRIRPWVVCPCPSPQGRRPAGA